MNHATIQIVWTVLISTIGKCRSGGAAIREFISSLSVVEENVGKMGEGIVGRLRKEILQCAYVKEWPRGTWEKYGEREQVRVTKLGAGV
jgi:hypothetical protein